MRVLFRETSSLFFTSRFFLSLHHLELRSTEEKTEAHSLPALELKGSATTKKCRKDDGEEKRWSEQRSSLSSLRQQEKRIRGANGPAYNSALFCIIIILQDDVQRREERKDDDDDDYQEGGLKRSSKSESQNERLRSENYKVTAGHESVDSTTGQLLLFFLLSRIFYFHDQKEGEDKDKRSSLRFRFPSDWIFKTYSGNGHKASSLDSLFSPSHTGVVVAVAGGCTPYQQRFLRFDEKRRWNTANAAVFTITSLNYSYRDQMQNRKYCSHGLSRYWLHFSLLDSCVEENDLMHKGWDALAVNACTASCNITQISRCDPPTDTREKYTFLCSMARKRRACEPVCQMHETQQEEEERGFESNDRREPHRA